MKSSKNKKSYSWVKVVIVLVGVLSVGFLLLSFHDGVQIKIIEQVQIMLMRGCDE